MKIDAIMVTRFTTKYSKNICEKREEDKSKAVFERKKNWYLNNAKHSKDRDESHPEERGKHGKFTTKFPNNGKHDRKNRSRSKEGTKEVSKIFV